jgi:hypothetical protein
MAKAGLSTVLKENESDYFSLSVDRVHFCTFYVDKIVSKAYGY